MSKVILKSIFRISIASSVCCRLRGGSSSSGIPSKPALAVSSVSGQLRPSMESNWLPKTHTGQQVFSTFSVINPLFLVTLYTYLWFFKELPKRLIPWRSCVSCDLMSVFRAVSRKVRRRSKKCIWTDKARTKNSDSALDVNISKSFYFWIVVHIVHIMFYCYYKL